MSDVSLCFDVTLSAGYPLLNSTWVKNKK